MPQVIPAALALAGAAAGTGTLLGLSALAWSAASLASGLLIGSYEQRKAAKQQREQYNAAQVDRLANIYTTTGPRELVLGRVRKGGAIYFRGTAGYYRERFLAHLALAGHEIDAVEQIYLNDVPVTLDSEGNVLTAPFLQVSKETRVEFIPPGQSSVTLEGNPIDGTVSAMAMGPFFEGTPNQPSQSVAFTISGRSVTLAQPVPSDRDYVAVSYQYYDHHPKARIWWSLGDDDDTADARTRELFPDLWTENHRARGIAKLFCEFIYDENAFPSGLPSVSAVIRGARVYDPRLASMQWSDNPALLARHVYTHPYFGKATVSTAEEARFIAAANACDTTHPFVVSGGTDTQKLYRAALVVPYGTPARSVLDDLCQAMGGMWALAGGELHIKAGVYTAPVKTLSDADLAVVQRNGESEEQEAVTIGVHRERNDKLNVVNPRIWDAAQSFQEVEITPVRSAALIARDGQELSHDLPLPAVFFAPQAQHIAGVVMRDSRDSVTVEAPFKLTAFEVELFDTVALTIARYGWSGKTFIVLSRVWDREKGVIRLSLKETAAAIYTPDAEFLPQGYADNTSLPKPWEVFPPAITSDGIYSGTSELVRQADGGYLTRVRVTWPQLVDLSLQQGGSIEVQWMPLSGTAWQSIQLDGRATQTYIIGVQDGSAILIRARARNSVAVSDWSAQVAHVVLGKLEPPNPPTSVALTPDRVIFVPPTDVDLAGFRILYNAGTSTERSVATALHTGLVSGSPWLLPLRLYGVNTIIVVAVDIAGLESVAVSDTQDLGPPDEANIADTLDLVAGGYPGTITNGAVTDGVLVADADAAVDIYGAGSGKNIYFRDGAADIYGGDQFLQLVYTFIYSSPYDDGTVLMNLETTGVRTTVEYRVDGSVIGDVYSDDRADIYADDSDSIYGTSPGWSPWSGVLTSTLQNVGYEFRITVDAGSVQGSITVLEMRTELPQIEQMFGNAAIAAGGTFLAPGDGLPARSFIAIEGVLITPIGNVAVAGRVKNFPIDPTTGPEVELLDSSANPVDGTAFVRVSGY